MQRKIFFALFSILFFVNTVLAFSSDIEEYYQPKETILIKFSGETQNPIAFSDIVFTRGHVQIPIEYNIERLGGNYYLWAITPENPNNYTLIIKNIKTYENGVLTEIEYKKNFTVSGNVSEYNLKPGFITTKEDFEVIINYFGESSKQIPTNFPFSDYIYLTQGQNKITYSLEDIKGTQLIPIQIGKYTFIIYSIKEGEPETPFVSSNIHFEPSLITLIQEKDKGIKKYSISLSNLGDTEIKNIELSYNDSLLSLSADKIKSLKSGESYSINLSLKERIAYDIQSTILASSTNNTALLNVFVKYIVPSIPISNNNASQVNNSLNYYCAQLDGYVCAPSTTCEGESLLAKDGACCLGLCKEKPSIGNSWIGYLILGVVILIAAFIFSRYRKNSKPSKVFELKVANAEKKFKKPRP